MSDGCLGRYVLESFSMFQFKVWGKAKEFSSYISKSIRAMLATPTIFWQGSEGLKIYLKFIIRLQM